MSLGRHRVAEQALTRDRLLDLFNSYYGGLTCVRWTPDGKYILTGGQDDLISIWSLADSALVARCQGHQSWVSALAFDPWRCDDRNYRFGSVGEDGRLCLWDFGVGMLHRPKVRKPSSWSEVSADTAAEPGATAMVGLIAVWNGATHRLGESCRFSNAVQLGGRR